MATVSHAPGSSGRTNPRWRPAILSPRRDRVLFTLFNNHLKSRLATALADPDETGGAYLPTTQPAETKAWTHRHRGEGRTRYELFDQIWLSRELARKQTGASIQRRTTRGGDASDHDPAYIELLL
jgi:hypothetical protein